MPLEVRKDVIFKIQWLHIYFSGFKTFPWQRELQIEGKTCRGQSTLKSKPYFSINQRKWKWSPSVLSNSFRPHRLKSTRLLCPWDFPSKNTGVGCHFLLQGICPTQGSNLGLPHCSQTFLPSETPGKSQLPHP